MAKILIINTSKMRVAINNIARLTNDSMTSYCKKINIDNSNIPTAEDRFRKQYANKVDFEIDKYTTYGAMYLDVYEQFVNGFGLDGEDFIEQEIESEKKNTAFKELEKRIETLEEKVLNLMIELDKLNKRVNYNE